VLLTVTDELVAVAEPHALVAVTVKTPAFDVLIAKAAGFWPVTVNPPGPAHEYEVALVAELVSVRLVPTHNEVGEALAETEEGVAATLNVAEATPADIELLQPPVPTIFVNVTVVEPTLVNLAAGIVKLPPDGLVTVTLTVLLEETLAPVKL
jgi:hypothetical protein